MSRKINKKEHAKNKCNVINIGKITHTHTCRHAASKVTKIKSKDGERKQVGIQQVGMGVAIKNFIPSWLSRPSLTIT